MLHDLLNQNWGTQAVDVVVVASVIIVVVVVVVVVICENEWFLPSIVRGGILTLLTLGIHLLNDLFSNFDNLCFIQRTFCHKVSRDGIEICLLLIASILEQKVVDLSVCVVAVTTEWTPWSCFFSCTGVGVVFK